MIIAGQIGQPCLKSSAMSTPDSPSIDATERSISPVTTMSVRGSARIATSPTFRLMKKRFVELRKYGDTLAPYNHPSIAAGLLKPFVSEANHWMVEHHGIFQGYYFFHYLGMDRDLRENFRGHAHF